MGADSKYHRILANYFTSKPLFLSKNDDVRPNIRKLQELPWQLNNSKNWKQLFSELKYLSFLKLLAFYYIYDLHEYWGNLERKSKFHISIAYKSIIVDPAVDIHAAHDVDNLLGHHGYIEEAIDLREKLVDYYISNNDNHNLARTYGNLGLAYEYVCEPEKALSYFEQSIQLAEQIGDINTLISGLQNKSQLLITLRKLKLAISYNEHALRISRQLGNLRSEAGILLNQGIAFYLQGKLDDATKNVLHSQFLFKNLQDFDGYQKATGELGIFEMQCNPSKAMAHFKEQEAICRKYNITKSLSSCLENQGALEMIQGNPNKARDLYQKQAEISHKTGDFEGVFKANFNTAFIYFKNGYFENSRIIIERAIVLGRDLKVKTPFEKALVIQGHLLAFHGMIDDALVLYNEAIQKGKLYLLAEEMSVLCCMVGDFLLPFYMGYKDNNLISKEWVDYKTPSYIDKINDFLQISIHFYQQAIDIHPSNVHAIKMMELAYKL